MPEKRNFVAVSLKVNGSEKVKGGSMGSYKSATPAGAAQKVLSAHNKKKGGRKVTAAKVSVRETGKDKVMHYNVKYVKAKKSEMDDAAAATGIAFAGKYVARAAKGGSVSRGRKGRKVSSKRRKSGGRRRRSASKGRKSGGRRRRSASKRRRSASKGRKRGRRSASKGRRRSASKGRKSGGRRRRRSVSRGRKASRGGGNRMAMGAGGMRIGGGNRQPIVW